VAARTDCDVLIVGGGIAGLTAAAFAARGGARTRLMEGAPSLGGRARTREQDGFSFNLGAHALYLGGAGKRTLDALGIDPAGGAPDLKPAFLVQRGEVHALPRGLRDLATTSPLSIDDRHAYREAFAAIAKGFACGADEAIGAALRRLTASVPVQAALLMLTRLTSYSHAPETTSAAALLDQLLLAGRGVVYLHHGWGAMAAALSDAARGAGAILETGARVARTEPTARGWRAVTLAGDAIETSALVLAVSPAEAAALAPSVAALKAASEAAVPVRAAALDVALSRLPDPQRCFALGLDAPTYLSVHSLAARLGPEGGALIHVVRFLGPQEKPTPAMRGELEALLDRMQPGWRDVLVSEQWLPLATVAHDTPQAARSGLSGRCPVSIAPGLYVAGDWAGTEGLLSEAAFASGRLAGEGGAACQARPNVSLGRSAS
jgi:phytoene dehydrogenase-like protein